MKNTNKYVHKKNLLPLQTMHRQPKKLNQLYFCTFVAQQIRNKNNKTKTLLDKKTQKTQSINLYKNNMKCISNKRVKCIREMCSTEAQTELKVFLLFLFF